MSLITVIGLVNVLRGEGDDFDVADEWEYSKLYREIMALFYCDSPVVIWLRHLKKNVSNVWIL